MKIGILSDTHGNIPATEKVVDIFRKARVKAVFHCGDIGSFDVLSLLAGIQVPVHAVFGNADIYSNDWKFFPTNIGVQLHGRFGEIELDGKKIAFIHSDDQSRFNSTISCGDYDLVFSGHSHVVHDYKEGRTRCINPGTAGRGAPNTCAALDLKTGILKVVKM